MHRTRKVTPQDFDKPWRLSIFRRKKVAYVKCEFCRVASLRGIYNRAAYKHGDDNIYNIRRELP